MVERAGTCRQASCIAPAAGPEDWSKQVHRRRGSGDDVRPLPPARSRTGPNRL